MSTIKGIDSWAVDLAEVGPVYPFQGAEGVMAIVGIALWIGWHVWQIRAENAEIEEDLHMVDKRKKAMHEIDRY